MYLIKTKINLSSLDLKLFWVPCFDFFFLLAQIFNHFAFQYFGYELTLPDEGYSTNTSLAVNNISIFLLSTNMIHHQIINMGNPKGTTSGGRNYSADPSGAHVVTHGF